MRVPRLRLGLVSNPEQSVRPSNSVQRPHLLLGEPSGVRRQSAAIGIPSVAGWSRIAGGPIGHSSYGRPDGRPSILANCNASWRRHRVAEIRGAAEWHPQQICRNDGPLENCKLAKHGNSPVISSDGHNRRPAITYRRHIREIPLAKRFYSWGIKSPHDRSWRTTALRQRPSESRQRQGQSSTSTTRISYREARPVDVIQRHETWMLGGIGRLYRRFVCSLFVEFKASPRALSRGRWFGFVVIIQPESRECRMQNKERRMKNDETTGEE
jgi:hypothetical protein